MSTEVVELIFAPLANAYTMLAAIEVPLIGLSFAQLLIGFFLFDLLLGLILMFLHVRQDDEGGAGYGVLRRSRRTKISDDRKGDTR